MILASFAGLNHNALVVLVALLLLVLGVMIAIYLRQRKTLMATQKMSVQLDELIEQMMLMQPGDYKIRSETFQAVKRHHIERAT